MKWSLVDGTTLLDYLLADGLTGVVDSGLTGPDGQYADVRGHDEIRLSVRLALRGNPAIPFTLR